MKQKNSEFLSSEKTLCMPSALFRKYRVWAGQRVTLKAGAAKTEVYIRQSQKSGGGGRKQFVLSARAAKDLKIPGGITLRIKQEEPTVFRLGPVIGLLTFQSIFDNEKFGYYRPMVRLNKDKGVFFVFSSQTLFENTIIGYYYDHQKAAWRAEEFSYPDVVIDRCYPNNYQCHSILEKVIGKKIFNRKTRIDKLNFAETLVDNDFLKAYIPETRLFQDDSDLDYFLTKYGGAFLKPVDSMMGSGIIQVQPEGEFLKCLYVRKSSHITENITECIFSVKEITGVLLRAAGREREYIVQQPVSRMTFNGDPFSFRVWAMKNGNGRWVVPGMFAKSATTDGFLTNFTAGARLVSLADIISDVSSELGCTDKALIRLLHKLTLKTARALDKKYGPLGELGMDIVFDVEGRPWLIEANGNPGRAPIFLQKDYPEWRRLIYQHPLDYAAFLADFKGEFDLVTTEEHYIY